MRADRAKQLLKNGVYRAIGETVAGAGGLDGEAERTLRVLMYHKVNDLRPNPTTVPTRVFEEQMQLLAELGYVPVSLGRCATTTSTARRFPRGSPHHVRRRVPRQPRERAAGPAAPRVSGGDLRADRVPRGRSSAAARGAPARARRAQRDGRLGRARGARSRGDPRRVPRDRPPPRLRARAGEAAREIALSKLRLEERLGRPVDAYAFVKGSLADYRPEHVSLVQQAGYALGFTSVSGANGPSSDRFRLRRYNVEPYPPRTFELVLSGACDLISVKDTVPGTYARRAFNKVLGTATR